MGRVQANSGGTAEAGGSVRPVPWALLWEPWSSGLGWQMALEFAYLHGSIQTEVHEGCSVSWLSLASAKLLQLKLRCQWLCMMNSPSRTLAYGGQIKIIFARSFIKSRIVIDS